MDISFETNDDKWKWGGIIGGAGLAVLTTGVMIGCLCKRCLRERAALRETAALYKAKANMTQLCVDGQNTVNTLPSAPPYEATAV